MNQTNLKFVRYTTVKSEFRYCLKIQLFSSNRSHHCLPNVEVWDDVEQGIKNFLSRTRFTNLGEQVRGWGDGLEVGEITLPNTDIAILSFYPKTQSYKVEGTRRKQGAIGLHSSFYVFVRAENKEQAETIARQGSEIWDYEHVHIKKVVEDIIEA